MPLIHGWAANLPFLSTLRIHPEIHELVVLPAPPVEIVYLSL